MAGLSEGKLMLLGGSAYLLPVISAAHSLGYEVVTCDNEPENHAHHHSDAYENASVVDRDAVLAAARRQGISGIMSFATDPGVTSAAYVAEQMGLPCIGSLQAVETLQDKVRFRQFLQSNGFASPRSLECRSVDQVLDLLNEGWGPVVVKPADSAGSKGVRRVERLSDFSQAVEAALRCSRSGACIVEETVEGRPIESDVLVLDGVVQTPVVSDQLHDRASANPLAPIGSVIPAREAGRTATALQSQLQKLANLLGLRTGLCNVEARVLPGGAVVLMEVSPRGAGANIALIQHEAGGPDLIAAGVRAALGKEVRLLPWRLRKGVFVHDMLHARIDGRFGGVEYDPGFWEAHVVRETLWVREGDFVHAMHGSGDAFGSLLLRFDDWAGYAEFWDCGEKPYRLVVRP